MFKLTLISFVCLGFALPTVFGCSCIFRPYNIRTAVCDTENTVVFKVTGPAQQSSSNQYSTIYPVVVAVAYKTSPSVNVQAINSLGTASQSAACGVTLEVGQFYIYHGSINNNVLPVSLCSNYRLFSSLSVDDYKFLVKPNHKIKPIPTLPTIGPITGWPTTVTGFPTIGTGSPSTITGFPTIGTGSPSTVTGFPTIGTGFPTIGTGSPVTGTGSPSTVTGFPTTVTTGPTFTPGPFPNGPIRPFPNGSIRPFPGRPFPFPGVFPPRNPFTFPILNSPSANESNESNESNEANRLAP